MISEEEFVQDVPPIFDGTDPNVPVVVMPQETISEEDLSLRTEINEVKHFLIFAEMGQVAPLSNVSNYCQKFYVKKTKPTHVLAYLDGTFQLVEVFSSFLHCPGRELDGVVFVTSYGFLAMTMDPFENEESRFSQVTIASTLAAACDLLVSIIDTSVRVDELSLS